ncbi:HK97 gp10 family phage protein [Stutzerimonas nitrititolerans]
MSFSDDVRRFSAKAAEAHDKIARTAALELFTGVIRSTPVDTGRARGNWQTSVGQPTPNEIERDDKSGAQVIGEVQARTPERAGQEVFLTNNLPYIYSLEYGSSKKAPEGMVRINFARVQKIVAKAIAKNKV